MKRKRCLVAILLVVLMLAGCYDVKVRLQVFPNGELLVTHDVVVPASVYDTRRSALGLSPQDVENDLRQSLEQDAALIGKARVIDAAVHRVGTNVLLQRRVIFTDPARAARYLELLGLTGEISVKKGDAAVAVKAAKLELARLVRLGKFYEETKAPATADNSQSPSGNRFTLQLDLPGNLVAEEPLARRDNGELAWSVEEAQFDAPFQAAAKTKAEKFVPWPGAAGAKVDGEAIARLLAAFDDAAAADYTRRLGGRITPILHLRLDKNLKVDWAILWAGDEIGRAAAQYQARVDALLLPELGHNYYRWLETVGEGERRTVAEGYRTRQPLPAKDLGGPLTVTRQGNEARVVFAPPAVYRQIAAAGPASRIVGMLVVTFPDGREQSRVITAADLQSGRPVELTGPLGR